MAVEERTVFQIHGVVQNYPWGKIGSASEVGQFFHLNSGQLVDEKQPYAGIDS